MSENSIETIAIASLTESPFQGRFMSIKEENTDKINFDVNELIDSIKISGLLQPITVRKVADGYQIIDGHRRVLAYKQIGETHIEAIVKNCGERDAQILSIVGNLQRKNLSRIELAITYSKALDMGYFNDKKELSQAIGKDATYVGDTINLLSMDNRIVDDLLKNNTIRDVRLLRMIRNYAKSKGQRGRYTSEKQWKLYQRILNENLSREEVANQIKDTKSNVKNNYWSCNSTKRLTSIKFNTTHLTDSQKDLLNSLIEQKMSEIENEIKQFD